LLTKAHEGTYEEKKNENSRYMILSLYSCLSRIKSYQKHNILNTFYKPFFMRNIAHTAFSDKETIQLSFHTHKGTGLCAEDGIHQQCSFVSMKLPEGEVLRLINAISEMKKIQLQTLPL
jgi:hypothetical protein